MHVWFFNPKDNTNGSCVDQNTNLPSFWPIDQKPSILHWKLFWSLNSNVKWVDFDQWVKKTWFCVLINAIFLGHAVFWTGLSLSQCQCQQGSNKGKVNLIFRYLRASRFIFWYVVFLVSCDSVIFVSELVVPSAVPVPTELNHIWWLCDIWNSKMWLQDEMHRCSFKSTEGFYMKAVQNPSQQK